VFRLFVHGLKKGLLMSETTLFLVFATFTLLSALMVIRSKNPVYSVLFLILVFCNAAGLLVLLDLDFFAVVFLVVYVGAVAVLFLFVVMMLDITISEVNETFLRYLPIGAFIGCIFLMEVFLMLGSEFTPVNMLPQDFSLSNVFTIFYFFCACFFVYTLFQPLVAFTGNQTVVGSFNGTSRAFTTTQFSKEFGAFCSTRVHPLARNH
jgi:NADH:ubiquinone oxidoreductase subunit 6 (subunit J)